MITQNDLSMIMDARRTALESGTAQGVKKRVDTSGKHADFASVMHQVLDVEGLAAGPGKRASQSAGMRMPEANHTFRAPHNAIPLDRKPVDKRLMDACVEMESLFVSKMLKEMRKTVQKGEMLHGGFAEEIFEDMLYDNYALEMSKTANMGLAKMLYGELSKK
ncbi:MAG TPA: rod-binding protein [Spirochaetota bacterium]|nr:rod-binding protein [Spirochaetota bacterium]HNT11794.1 rod-binding protein [Spirochaetota bacterium]